MGFMQEHSNRTFSDTARGAKSQEVFKFRNKLKGITSFKANIPR